MSHFARIDGNNIVIEFIVADQEYIDTGKLGDPDMWLLSADENGGFRHNRAGIGFTYSHEDDAFIPPKPYDSWVLNKTNFTWEPPVPMPGGPSWVDEDGTYNNYLWDEEKKEWYIHSKPYIDTVAIIEENSTTTP